MNQISKNTFKISAYGAGTYKTEDLFNFVILKSAVAIEIECYKRMPGRPKRFDARKTVMDIKNK